MSPLFDMTDIIVSFLHRFRLYGISAYDTLQIMMWGTVAFILVYYFLDKLNSGGS